MFTHADYATDSSVRDKLVDSTSDRLRCPSIPAIVTGSFLQSFYEVYLRLRKSVSNHVARCSSCNRAKPNNNISRSNFCFIAPLISPCIIIIMILVSCHTAKCIRHYSKTQDNYDAGILTAVLMNYVWVNVLLLEKCGH